MKKPIALLLLAMMTMIACKTEYKENTVTPETGTATIQSTSPHAPHHDKYTDFNFTSEAQWDSLLGHTNTTVPKPVKQPKRHKDYKTFGWHLYSKGSAYKNYNFSLLWGISYFSYHVDPETGSYKSIHQWKTTALVDSAKVHNTKVFLTVSNFGSTANAKFLADKKAQQTLADSLDVLLKLRNANGINIDFESVPSKSRTAFNEFIVFISEQLKQKNPDYKVSLALYAVDYHKVFDIKTINPYIDFYTLMSYDYYGGFSKHAGPIAPLKSSTTWGKNSMETSVDYYLNEGVNPEKLIVGISYYGGEWQVQDSTIPGEAKKFYTYLPYSTVKKNYIDSLKVQVHYDTLSYSNYFTLKEPGGTLRQIWFDDSLSLAHKYDWIKTKKLSGAGIWALGYDQGDTELWNLLAAKFGKNE